MLIFSGALTGFSSFTVRCNHLCIAACIAFWGLKMASENKLSDKALNLRITDDGHRAVRIYLAGNIKPIQINNIAEKLAVAGVQDAKLYKGIPDHEPEGWREYLSRLREQVEVSIGEGRSHCGTVFL